MATNDTDLQLNEQIDKYQSYIDNYNKIQAEANGTVAAKAITEANSNTQTAFNAKKTAAAVFSEIQEAKNTFNKPPRYFKPVFLLEELTPRIHASIYLAKESSTSFHSGVEKYDLFNSTVQPTLNNPDPLPTHNYIKSFTYNVFGDQGDAGQKATLEVVDVDASLIEAMVLRFQTLSYALGGEINPDSANIMIEVTYGWYVPEAMEERYSRLGNNSIVCFTNTVLFVLEKPEVKFNMDGTINCTFHLRANANLVPPFTWWTPFREFKIKYPLLPLGVNNVFLNMFNFWNTYNKNNKTPKEFILRFGTWFYLEMMAGSDKLEDLHNFMDSVAKIFKISAQIPKVETILTKPYLLTKAKQYFGTNDADSIAKGIVKSTAINNETATTISVATLLKQALGKITNNNLVSNNGKKIAEAKLPSSSTLVKDSIAQQLNDALFKNKDNTSGSYDRIIQLTEEYKKDKKQPNNFQDWTNFLNKLTSFVLDWEIHPLVAEIYILEIFFRAVKAYQAKNPGELEVLYIPMLSQSNILPQGYYDTILEGKSQFFTRAQKEQWCKKISEYSINPSTPWIDFLHTLMVCQKFNFKPTDGDNVTATMMGSAQVSKGSKEYTKVPAAIQSNSMITTSKGAVEQLKLMQKLLKASSKINTSSLQKTEEIIDKHLAKANASINTAKMKQWLFLIKDQMPGGGFYDPAHGESSILQAFSFRAALSPEAAANEQWNPGYPSCWDVNFMDILSFEPEFDFWTAQTAVSQNMIPLKYKEGMAEYTDKDIKSRQELTEQFLKIQSALTTSKTISEETKKKNIVELQDLVNQLKQLESNSIIKERVGAYPVTFNMDFEKKVSNNGSVPEVLAAKKSLQQFRNRMMTEVLNIKAKMTVIADPSFKYNDAQKYIFVKVINNDGSTSIFTGLYRINSCTQKISAGNFLTEMEIMRDSTTSSEVADSMYQGIYNNDRMVNKNS
jgi:hypothetical protein